MSTLNIENGEIVYKYVVTLGHYSLDDANYWVNHPENVTMAADDREYLYRRLGELKALETAPEDTLYAVFLRRNYYAMAY